MESKQQELPPALTGERHEFSGRVGRLCYYRDGPDRSDSARPLLLIHSINAAAGAHEVRPLFDHYRQSRPVYALDLPGYGMSERSDRAYTPRLMTDAVQDVLGEIQRHHGAAAIDALAVSLSCEYLSRAAQESPADFHSLALVSPTGFNRAQPKQGVPGSNRGLPWLHRTLTLPGLGRGLFSLLTSRRSIRYFLEKTWGSRDIDEPMFEYAYRTAHQPGARHAPFYFLSGFLFSGDINAVYEALTPPVWMSHGTRGDFTDYRLKTHFETRDTWQFDVFEAGALPYFEQPERFITRYEAFLASLEPSEGQP